MATSAYKGAELRKVNGELVQVYPETVTDNVTVNGYSKPASASAIANGDILNTALGKLEKALDGKAAAAHGHGNISSDGKVGSTSGLPLITSAGGIVTTGSFGTAAGTFCQGNDSRLSNARTPTSHSHGQIGNDGKISSGTANAVVVTDANKTVTTSTITTTELGYLSGASANIQSQINGISTAIAGGVTIKGTIGTDGTITALPASHAKGDAYYAIAGAPSVNGTPLEAGDMVICVTDGTTAKDSDWAAVQNNVSTMTAATASSAGTGGLVPAPAAGKQASYLRGDGTWAVPTDTDTHHQAKIVVGTSGGTANSSASNPYLNLVENGAVRSTQQVKGGGTVTVNSDASGNITFSGAATNTVTQTVTTTAGEYPLLAKNTTATATITDAARFAAGATLNPNTNTITAAKFKGDLDGKLANARTISLGTDVSGSASFDGSADVTISATLANTGVTSGSYGPSANATPGYGATFNVPYITVDAKGRVTAASTKTVKIPASDNVNTTYTLTASQSGNTATLTPSSGTAQTVNLPKWASHGTSLPSAEEIAAMPEGATFILLSE